MKATSMKLRSTKPTARNGLLLAVALVLTSLAGCSVNIRSSGWSSPRGTIYSQTYVNGRPVTTMQWEEDGMRRFLRLDGELHLSSDDKEVASLGPNGRLSLSERSNAGTRELRIETGPEELTYHYRRNGGSAEFSADAKAWLAEILRFLIERTSIGAAERARRILKEHGPDGLLASLERIQSGGAKKVYLRELLETKELSLPTLLRVAETAAQLSGSSSKSRLLKQVSGRYKQDAALTHAIVKSAATIRSSSSRQAVLTTIAEERSTSEDIVLALIQAAASMPSSSSRYSTLVAIVKRAPLTARVIAAYLRVAGGISSSTYQERSIGALIDRKDLPSEQLQRVPAAITKVSSSSARSRLLVRLAADARADVQLLALCLDATSQLSSSRYQAKVFDTVLARGDVDRATLKRAAAAAKKISSSSTRARIQQKILDRLVEE